MKKNLDEFLELNNVSKLFKDTEKAKTFYTSLKIENTPVAIAILLNEFERIGWSILNDNLGNTSLYSHLLLSPIDIEGVLKSRIDDFIVSLSSIPNMSVDYGNYLLTDIINLDSKDNFVLAKESIFMTNIAFYVANNSDAFKRYLVSFSRNATFTDSLSYFVESLILYKFINYCKKDFLSKEIEIFKNIIDKNREIIKFKLKFANDVFSRSNDNSPISRILVTKIQSNTDLKFFVNRLKAKSSFTPLVNTLDILDDI